MTAFITVKLLGEYGHTASFRTAVRTPVCLIAFCDFLSDLSLEVLPSILVASEETSV
jgi:hypothetical protein